MSFTSFFLFYNYKISFSHKKIIIFNLDTIKQFFNFIFFFIIIYKKIFILQILISLHCLADKILFM